MAATTERRCVFHAILRAAKLCYRARMDVNLHGSDAPVRAAASVVMLRDGAQGLEVFLVKRHGLSDVLGGAHVFPGGKVDREDGEESFAIDVDAAALHAALGEAALDARDATALYVAAVREAFEETGVLFAREATAAVASQATSLLREGRAFDEVVSMMGLTLCASLLQPWSRWVTPSVGGVMRKRFDTRFFLARVPTGQLARHDEHEAVESEWLRPAQALQLYWERKIELAPPQIMELAQLVRHADVASAFAQARGRRPPLVHPAAFEQGGRRFVCYPGDERHPVRERALLGPTRLCFCEGRFEPEGGLGELLSAAA